MAAEIIQLDTRRSRQGSAASGRQGHAMHALGLAHEAACDAEVPRFQFWTGVSGTRYVHSVYTLLTCPQLPAGNFVLVRRGLDGSRTPLAVGRVTNTAHSLNLAEIRHQGACLGANEVHVHLLADNAKKAKLIEYDVRAAVFGVPETSDARH